MAGLKTGPSAEEQPHRRRGREEDRRGSREAGFDAHLVKPADPDERNALLTRGRGGT